MRLSHKSLIGTSLFVLFLFIGGARSEIISCAYSVIANGTFDKDISSWGPVQGVGAVQWSGEDALGSPRSGALFLANASLPGGQNTSVSQCQAIAPGLNYDLRAKIKPANYCCTPQGTRATRHTGFLYVLLNFYPKPSCGGSPLPQFVRLDATGDNEWQALGQTFSAPAQAASVRTTLAIYKNESVGDLAGTFDDIVLTAAGASKSDPGELCLGKGRFSARAQWTTGNGQTGGGLAVVLSSDTGYFCFFDSSNVELIVKVLNGCAVNSRYWAFAGGLTDVGVKLTITDTATGAVQTYNNPLGTPFLPIQDAAAFSSCATAGSTEGASASSRADPVSTPASTEERLPSAAAAASTCVPDAQTLCLNLRRFAVTTQWATPDGATGAGVPVQLTADTGYFWFFSPTNVEMITKILDGCGVTGSYWVFAGGLTNVNVVMTVRDTQTGAVRTYTNPQGTAFLPIQDVLAFPSCP